MKLWLKLDKQELDVPVYTGKLRFLTIAAIIGVILSLGFAVWELMNGNSSRAMADLIFPLTAPYLVYCLWRKPDSTRFILHVFALMIFASQVTAGFYLYDFKQMIWMPTYPLFYFYLLGHRGWLWSLVLFVTLWMMYVFYPQLGEQERVSFHVMNNFMIAYMLTAALSWMNSREVLFYQHKIIQRAHYDHLTGVYNRAAWMERAEQLTSSKIRNPERMLSGIILDVDDFKHFNDQYGHHTGDQVLKMVSDCLSSRLRKSDILGRWGGEEFIILLPDTGLKEAMGAAESLRLALLNIDAHNVSASFGVAEFDEDDTLDSMLIRADKNLYRAKAEGKNRVVA